MPKSKDKIQTGWEGRFYEDFEVGDVYRSRFGHTVTETDNALFTQLTHNTNPLHFDQNYAQQTKWGQILVNSTFTPGTDHRHERSRCQRKCDGKSGLGGN